MEGRSKDGVPRYNGDPVLLMRYREEALQYAMGIEDRKRYLVGPRLLQELTGTARVITRAKTLQDPQWLSHPRGVYQLLEFLEAHLQKPSLVEASQHVIKFFYNLQRHRGESMTDWCARHAEALWEASSALRKVQKEYGNSTGNRVSREQSERSQWDWNSTSSNRGATNTGPFRDDGRLDEAEDEEASQGGADDWWHQHGWSRHESQQWWETNSWRSAYYEPPQTWDTSNEIFIPEFLAGFLLLHRSGLEPNQKSSILGAIRGEFSTITVARALREQWADGDLAKHDKQKASAMVAVEDDEEEAYYQDEDFMDMDGLDDDVKEVYMAEQARIDSALEAIRVNTTTLKEARWNQKQMKLNRSYFPAKPFQKNQKPGVKCFKCGGPHFQDQCPQRHQKSAKVATEAAEIAFGASEVEPNPSPRVQDACSSSEEAFVAADALEQCMGIIDSGATASLGSIDALESIVKKNIAQKGDTRVGLDLGKKPTFRFGNGLTKTCVSTAQVKVDAGNRQGSMEVHVHDTPQQPVLVSRKALKNLGAVIDFERNQAVYRHIDPKMVVTLKEAENGHLLMPLTGNLTAGGMARTSPFQSLSDE